jgi:FkbM family methyltransferase
LTFEHLGAAEAEFLHDEIFVRRSYLQHGVTLTGRAGVVVDVGANIGLFALFCKQECPACTVVCFEPNPAAVSVLRRNVRPFGDSVTVLPCALAADDGVATFTCMSMCTGECTRYSDEARDMRSVLQAAVAADTGSDAPPSSSPPSPSLPSPATTADDPDVQCRFECAVVRTGDALCRLGVCDVELLKVDVEGDELEVLLGIDAWQWRLIRQVVVEVHDVHDRLQDVVRLLQGTGYTVQVQQQNTVCRDDGYVAFIPLHLRLFMVYAVRP